MYVRAKRREAVKDPVTYIRNHLDKTDSEVARITGETEYFVKVVREQAENPELQRGYRANQQWKEKDKESRQSWYNQKRPDDNRYKQGGKRIWKLTHT